MKKFILLLYLLFTGFCLYGCGNEEEFEITSIEIIGDQTQFNEDFQLSDISVRVNKSDGDFDIYPLDKTMLSDEDLLKFNQEGKQNITVTYLGVSTTFEITIRGEKGYDGKEVQLQIVDGYIQWKHEGDSSWVNLIALSALTGNDGQDGNDGKEIELKINGEYIQWKYIDDDTWKNLLAIATITGNDGKEIELQVFNGYIQWKHEGDSSWNDLLPLNLITGAKGDNGANGKEVEFNVIDNEIQWRYVGDQKWTKLISLSSLRGPKGDDGDTPLIEISEDGYWVINGVKTTSRATYEEKPIEFYTVSFDSNGGELSDGANELINVIKGETIDLPVPYKDGYIFVGWFTGNTINDGQIYANSLITENLNLVAKWKSKYSVSTLTEFIDLFDINTSKNYQLNINAQMCELDKSFKFFEDISLQEELFIDYENDITFTHSIENYSNYYNEVYNYTEFEKHFSFKKEDNNNEFYYSNYPNYPDIYYMYELLFMLLDYGSYIPYNNIYQYNISPENAIELIDKYFFIFGEIYNLKSYHISSTIDLNLMIFTIDIEFIDINDQGLSMQYEIEITKINEIVPIIPKEVYISAINYQLQYLNLDYADTYMVDEFYDKIDTYKLEMNIYSNEEYYYYLHDIFNFIRSYDFDIDILNQEKDEALFMMNETYNYNLAIAKDEIIPEITNLYDQYVNLVNDCLNTETIWVYYNLFANKIDEINEIDNFQYELYMTKKDVLEFLEIYIENFEINNEIKNIYLNYEALIEESSNFEEIEILRLQCINEYGLIDNGNIDIRYKYYIYGLENLYYEIQSYEKYQDNPIDDEITNYLLQLNTVKELKDFITLFLKCHILLEIKLLELEKDEVISNITDIYNYNLLIVEDDAVEPLITYYNETIESMNIVHSTNRLNNLSNDFYNFIHNINIDDLKLLKYEKSDKIYEYLNDYHDNVTNESLTAMTTIVNIYLDLIVNAITEEEAIDYYFQAIKELDKAIVLDNIKNNLIEYKLYLKNHLYMICSLFNVEIDDLMDEYSSDIDNAKTAEESHEVFEQCLNKFYSKISNIDPIILQKLNVDMKYNFYHEIEYRYNEITYLFNYEEVKQYSVVYKNYLYLLLNASNIFNLLDTYIDCLDFIEKTKLSIIRNIYISDFKENYEYFSKQVTGDTLTKLNEIYSNTIEITNGALTSTVLEIYYNDFFSYINSIELDTILETKFQTINKFENMFNQYKNLVTDESLIELEAIYNNFLSNIDDCQTISEINEYMVNVSDEFMNSIVLDAVKCNIKEYKDFLFKEISDFTLLFENYDYEYDTLYFKYINEIIYEDLFTYENILTKSDADELFYFIINNCLSYLNDDVARSFLQNLKFELLDKLESYYSLVVDCYPEDEEILFQDEYNNYILNISDSTKFSETIINYYNCLFMLENQYVNKLIFISNENLEEIYNHYKTLISEDSAIEFEKKYLKCMDYVNSSLNVNTLNEYMNEFDEYLTNMLANELMIKKIDSINLMENYYFELTLTATVDSITNMGLVYNEYIIYINDCDSIEQVNIRLDEFYTMILLKYIEDPEKIE